MPPTTPEQRFEVPPEYAEVYERAYRRAYEEGQGQLSSSEVADPVRRIRSRRGARLGRAARRAAPQSRAPLWAQQWPGQEADPDSDLDSDPERDPQSDRPSTPGSDPGGEPGAAPVEADDEAAPEVEAPDQPVARTVEVDEPVRAAAAPARSALENPTQPREPVPVVVVNPDELGLQNTDRHGHRARRRAKRSSAAAIIGLTLLALVLVAGSFVLGRLSVGRVDVPGVPAGAAPAAPAPPAVQSPASAAPQAPVRAIETGLAGLQAAMEPPGPYRGAVARLSGLRAGATCTAPADRDSRGRRVSYAPGNVLDGVAATAWLCQGSGVGQRLTITLPVTTDVVRLGLVPGYAKSDRYPKNNRVTRVAWVFDDGTRVVQTMDGSKKNRSLRTLRIDPVRTRTVVLQILGVARGAKNNTAISAVRLDTYAG